MARMAVSAVCDACVKDEARPLESKFGRESCHRSIPRLRGEQLSSRGSSPRSYMRPCVATSDKREYPAATHIARAGFGYPFGSFLPSLPLELL